MMHIIYEYHSAMLYSFEVQKGLIQFYHFWYEKTWAVFKSISVQLTQGENIPYKILFIKLMLSLKYHNAKNVANINYEIAQVNVRKRKCNIINPMSQERWRKIKKYCRVGNYYLMLAK